ncbi:MAG: DNA-3-methyladenine glycosylase 2 family protein [Planctomycetota bacterium]
MSRLDAAALTRARRDLARRDPALGAWIRHLGPVEIRRRGSHFTALARALIAQQLSNKAAATIITRCFAHFERPHRPTPEEMLALGSDELRAAGVSRQKEDYLRALAEAFVDGPLARVRFSTLEDEAIVERLVAIKGIGRWTAEMFLLFALARPDVFAEGDLALRRGIERLEGRGALTPAECGRVAERWRPWRSVASLYLWRIAHAEDEPA